MILNKLDIKVLQLKIIKINIKNYELIKENFYALINGISYNIPFSIGDTVNIIGKFESIY